jgi:hypothetical protein
MFAEACRQLRESVYGLNGVSQIGPSQLNASNATGFLIAPDVLATAAHFCHVENDPGKPVHSLFEVIRAPDIGRPMARATLIAEDSVRDIALLRLMTSTGVPQVRLETEKIPMGTSCGALGFPLASVAFSQTGRMFNLVERFQSASISAYRSSPDPSGRTLAFYETDALMYGGSSGCPGFLTDARVFGMQVASVVDQVAAQANASATPGGNRLAISIWVPAADIQEFANAQGISLQGPVA